MKVETSRRKKEMRKAVKGSQASYSTKAEKRVLEEESRLRQQLSFFYKHSKMLTALLLVGIICSGFYLRLLPTQAQDSLFSKYGRYFFIDVDTWFHYHFSRQIVQYGYRLDPDPETWAPQGRPVGHPPLFHYELAYLSLIFRTDLYETYLYYPIFIGAAGVVAWFLLCRKLYGDIGGLLGAAIYAIMPKIVGKAMFGICRPSGTAEVFLALGYLAFFIAKDSNRKILLPIPGLIFGVMTVLWEGTLYFHLPVLAAYWLACVLFKKANRKLHVLTLITLLVAGSIASLWFIPVFLRYGFLHANTPLSQTAAVGWYAGKESTLTEMLLPQPLLFIPPIIAYSFVVLYSLIHKKTDDLLALIFMTVGIVTSFFVGGRFLDIYLVYGVLMVFAASTAKIWKAAKINYKVLFAVFLIVLMISSFGISFSIYREYRFFSWEASQLSTVIGHQVPEGSIIVSWWTDGPMITGLGGRNVWDVYIEHLPEWAKERGKLVSEVYLASSEEEAIAACRSLNASYVLVNAVLDAAPNGRALRFMLKELGRNDDPSEYFVVNWETPPLGEISTKGELFVCSKGEQTMLYHFIVNDCKNFKLIWRSDEGGLMMLFKVDYQDTSA